MNIDDHPLRYSPLAVAIERVIFRRCLRDKIDGYALETSLEVAQAVVDLLAKPTPSLSPHSQEAEPATPARHNRDTLEG
jgi:hypothetical protein